MTRTITPVTAEEAQRTADHMAAIDAMTPAERKAHSAQLRQDLINALAAAQDKTDAEDITAGRAPRDWHLLDRVYSAPGGETMRVPHNAYAEANLARLGE